MKERGRRSNKKEKVEKHLFLLTPYTLRHRARLASSARRVASASVYLVEASSESLSAGQGPMHCQARRLPSRSLTTSMSFFVKRFFWGFFFLEFLSLSLSLFGVVLAVVVVFSFPLYSLLFSLSLSLSLSLSSLSILFSYLSPAGPPGEQVPPVLLVPPLRFLALAPPHAQAGVVRRAVAEQRGPDRALVAVAADGDRRRHRRLLPRRGVEAGDAHARLVLLERLEAVSQPQHPRSEPGGQFVDELVPREVSQAVVPFLEDAAGRFRLDPELFCVWIEVLHRSVWEEAGEDGGAELRVEGLEGGDAVS